MVVADPLADPLAERWTDGEVVYTGVTTSRIIIGPPRHEWVRPNTDQPCVDLAALQALVDEHYLTCREHPTADLLIWNYTDKTTFSRHWTAETMLARGLITDTAGVVKARPFGKFFGVDEHARLAEQGIVRPLPAERFEVYEKLDGSMGLLYHDGTDWAIASRGSFASEQAVVGTDLLREQYGHLAGEWRHDRTYCFEILYPENRIVVDYGGRRDLVLLAVLDTAIGKDDDAERQRLWELGVTPPGIYPGLEADTLEQLLERDERDNEEGYVLRFKPSGVRVKAKFYEYSRLHRLVCGLTPKTIWEWLADGRDVGDLLERVPPHFERWAREQAEALQARFDGYLTLTNAIYKDLGDRKANALYYQTTPVAHLLFAKLDGKPLAPLIWKLVKPVGGHAFRQEGV